MKKRIRRNPTESSGSASKPKPWLVVFLIALANQVAITYSAKATSTLIDQQLGPSLNPQTTPAMTANLTTTPSLIAQPTTHPEATIRALPTGVKYTPAGWNPTVK